jgi:hypothetical protein
MLSSDEVYARVLKECSGMLGVALTKATLLQLQGTVNNCVISMIQVKEIPKDFSFKVETDRDDPSLIHILPGNSFTWKWLEGQLKALESPQTQMFQDGRECAEARNPDNHPTIHNEQEH